MSRDLLMENTEIYALLESKLLEHYPDSDFPNYDYKIVKIFNYSNYLFVLFNKIDKQMIDISDINTGNSESNKDGRNCLYLFYYKKDTRESFFQNVLTLKELSDKANKNDSGIGLIEYGVYKNILLLRDKNFSYEFDLFSSDASPSPWARIYNKIIYNSDINNDNEKINLYRNYNKYSNQSIDLIKNGWEYDETVIDINKNTSDQFISFYANRNWDQVEVYGYGRLGTNNTNGIYIDEEGISHIVNPTNMHLYNYFYKNDLTHSSKEGYVFDYYFYNDRFRDYNDNTKKFETNPLKTFVFYETNEHSLGPSGLKIKGKTDEDIAEIEDYFFSISIDDNYLQFGNLKNVEYSPFNSNSIYNDYKLINDTLKDSILQQDIGFWSGTKTHIYFFDKKENKYIIQQYGQMKNKFINRNNIKLRLDLGEEVIGNTQFALNNMTFYFDNERKMVFNNNQKGFSKSHYFLHTTNMESIREDLYNIAAKIYSNEFTKYNEKKNNIIYYFYTSNKLTNEFISSKLYEEYVNKNYDYLKLDLFDVVSLTEENSPAVKLDDEGHLIVRIPCRICLYEKNEGTGREDYLDSFSFEILDATMEEIESIKTDISNFNSLNWVRYGMFIDLYGKQRAILKPIHDLISYNSEQNKIERKGKELAYYDEENPIWKNPSDWSNFNSYNKNEENESRIFLKNINNTIWNNYQINDETDNRKDKLEFIENFESDKKIIFYAKEPTYNYLADQKISSKMIFFDNSIGFYQLTSSPKAYMNIYPENLANNEYGVTLSKFNTVLNFSFFDGGYLITDVDDSYTPWINNCNINLSNVFNDNQYYPTNEIDIHFQAAILRNNSTFVNIDEETNEFESFLQSKDIHYLYNKNIELSIEEIRNNYKENCSIINSNKQSIWYYGNNRLISYNNFPILKFNSVNDVYKYTYFDENDTTSLEELLDNDEFIFLKHKDGSNQMLLMKINDTIEKIDKISSLILGEKILGINGYSNLNAYLTYETPFKFKLNDQNRKVPDIDSSDRRLVCSLIEITNIYFLSNPLEENNNFYSNFNYDIDINGNIILNHININSNLISIINSYINKILTLEDENIKNNILSGDFIIFNDNIFSLIFYIRKTDNRIDLDLVTLNAENKEPITKIEKSYNEFYESLTVNEEVFEIHFNFLNTNDYEELTSETQGIDYIVHSNIELSSRNIIINNISGIFEGFTNIIKLNNLLLIGQYKSKQVEEFIPKYLYLQTIMNNSFINSFYNEEKQPLIEMDIEGKEIDYINTYGKEFNNMYSLNSRLEKNKNYLNENNYGYINPLYINNENNILSPKQFKLEIIDISNSDLLSELFSEEDINKNFTTSIDSCLLTYENESSLELISSNQKYNFKDYIESITNKGTNFNMIDGFVNKKIYDPFITHNGIEESTKEGLVSYAERYFGLVPADEIFGLAVKNKIALSDFDLSKENDPNFSEMFQVDSFAYHTLHSVSREKYLLTSKKGSSSDDKAQNRVLSILTNNTITLCDMNGFIQSNGKDKRYLSSKPFTINFLPTDKENGIKKDRFNTSFTEEESKNIKLRAFFDIVEELTSENINPYYKEKEYMENNISIITTDLIVDNLPEILFEENNYKNDLVDSVNLLNDKVDFARCRFSYIEDEIEIVRDLYFILKNRTLLCFEALQNESIFQFGIRFPMDIILKGINEENANETVYIIEQDIKNEHSTLYSINKDIIRNILSIINKKDKSIPFNNNFKEYYEFKEFFDENGKMILFDTYDIIIPNYIENIEDKNNLINIITSDETTNKIKYFKIYNDRLFIDINGRILVGNKTLTNSYIINENNAKEFIIEMKDFYKIDGNVKDIYIEYVDIDANKNIVIASDRSEIYFFENLFINNTIDVWDNNSEYCLKYLYNFNNTPYIDKEGNVFYHQCRLPKVIDVGGSVENVTLSDRYLNTLSNEFTLNNENQIYNNKINFYKLSNQIYINEEDIKIEGKDENDLGILDDNHSYIKLEFAKIPEGENKGYFTFNSLSNNYNKLRESDLVNGLIPIINLHIKINNGMKLDDTSYYRFKSQLENNNGKLDTIIYSTNIQDSLYSYEFNNIDEKNNKTAVIFEDNNVYKNIYYPFKQEYLYDSFRAEENGPLYLNPDIELKIKYNIENIIFSQENSEGYITKIPKRLQVRDYNLFKDDNQYYLTFRFRYINTNTEFLNKYKFNFQIDIWNEKGEIIAPPKSISITEFNTFKWYVIPIGNKVDISNKIQLSFLGKYKEPNDSGWNIFLNVNGDSEKPNYYRPNYLTNLISLNKIPFVGCLDNSTLNTIQEIKEKSYITRLDGHNEGFINYNFENDEYYVETELVNPNSYINDNFMPLQQTNYSWDKSDKITINTNEFIMNGTKPNIYSNSLGLIQLSDVLLNKLSNDKRIIPNIYVNGLRLFNNLYLSKDMNNSSESIYLPIHSLKNYIPNTEELPHLSELIENIIKNKDYMSIKNILSEIEVVSNFGNINDEEKLLANIKVEVIEGDIEPGSKTSLIDELAGKDIHENTTYITTPYTIVKLEKNYELLNLIIDTKQALLRNLFNENEINVYILYNNSNETDKITINNKYARRINPRFFKITLKDDLLNISIRGLQQYANISNILLVSGTIQNHNLFFKSFDNDIEYIDLDNLTTSDNYQLFQYLSNEEIEDPNKLEIIANGYTLYPKIDYDIFKVGDLNSIVFRRIIPNNRDISMEINILTETVNTVYESQQAYAYRNPEYVNYSENSLTKVGKYPLSNYITLDNDKYQFFEGKFELFINNRKVPNDKIEVISTKTIRINEAIDYRKTHIAELSDNKYKLTNSLNVEQPEDYLTFDPKYKNILIRFQKIDNPLNYDLNIEKKYEEDNFTKLLNDIYVERENGNSCYVMNNSSNYNDNFDWLVGDSEESSLSRSNTLFEKNNDYDCNNDSLPNNIFIDGNNNNSNIIKNNIKIDCNSNEISEDIKLEVFIREVSTDYIIIKNTGTYEDSGMIYPTCTLLYYIGKNNKISIPKFFQDPLDHEDETVYIGTKIECTCFNYSTVSEITSISKSFDTIY